MIYNDYFPYIISGGVTVLVVLLGILIFFAVKNSSQKMNYEDQLEALIQDDEQIVVKMGIPEKWNLYWGDLFKTAGFTRYKEDNNAAGRDVIFGSVILAFLVALLTQNPLAGIGVSAALLIGSAVLIKNLSNKQEEKINYLLPGFIFALKANIQASETNERAMLKVIDSMPSPLYEDLVIVKNKLLASASFKESLESLAEKTSSKDLRFLAACMIQASESGANLESQLDSIQKVLEQRRKVADEVNRAVKSASPAMWLSTGVIPALFLASYFFDVSSRSFWFVEPVSWFALIATLVCYIGGMILVKRQVDAIKNL